MTETRIKKGTRWNYSERDVILYALSIGCPWSATQYVYENVNQFCVLPTFATLTLHRGALDAVDISKLVPNFNPMMLLHGEQYLEQLRPFPTAGSVSTTTEIIDVQDKGKAALVIMGLTTFDDKTGAELARNEVSTYIRGSGGFGKSSPKPRRPEAVARNDIPARPADAVIEEKTNPNQAALYRLNGDENPLHIDAEFAAIGGFSQPILHGLCTFGIAAKHVLQQYGDGDPANFRSIKGRFAKHVFPGETLRTEMWQDTEDKIIFRVLVAERSEIAISNAAVLLNRGQQRSKI